MKRTLSFLFAIIGWLAIIGQYVLMIGNSPLGLVQITIRFFSYFTILTNSLVAIYFTAIYLKGDHKTFFSNKGVLTAITTYITVVGLVYQIALRHIWKPEGFQMIVNELLHSVIPALVIVFWYLYETKVIYYKQILRWTIYPLVYFVWIMIYGRISGFYPYYFVDVEKIGVLQTAINAGVILLVFCGLASFFVFVGNRIRRG